MKIELHAPEIQSASIELTAPKRNSSLAGARIAIVHYWFVSRRGGERVVEAIADMFPHADICSLVVNRDQLAPSLQNRPIQTSFVQQLPGAARIHKHLLPLYPMALEQFDFTDYDIVISSESGPAKGILTGARTCHISYCHSPMRYLWDFYHRYRNGKTFGPITRPIFTAASHYLRMWDAASAARVDHFVANSRTVAARIRKHYRRESTVICPPVDVAAGYVSDRIDNYFLVAGQLVDYKRVDLAIEACNRLHLPLRIVGSGEQVSRLRKLAGPTVSFLGSLTDAELREQYARCRALLFPGEEDFGIVPVEALSFGRPVIAFGQGGATETVRGFYSDFSGTADEYSGVFFREQTVDSLIGAIHCFEAHENEFITTRIRQSVEKFGRPHFEERFESFVAEKWQQFQRQ